VSRQRRIAILTGIFPPDIGGPATSVPDLASALHFRGDAVTVVTLADHPGSPLEDDYEVVRIHRALPLPRRIASVVSAVRRAHPEVVLANGLHLESALLPGVPVVQKIVGDWAWERAINRGATTVEFEGFQGGRLELRARLLRSLRTHVTRRAATVIVPSRYLAGVVRGWGIREEDIRVVPNAAPPLQGASNNRPRNILFVGRLVRWKRVDDLLRAIQEIPDVELTIIGDGPLDGELQARASELCVANRVRFLGRQSRETIAKQMREKAAVLTLPSSYEGLPHVVLEAFSAGLPVVASDAGGNPELVRHGTSGLLHPCGDVAALRGRIREALDPRVAARLSAGGREIADAYTLDDLVPATVKVLDEALG
jgi:glycosyltransferase involved in cell wall biosynthesis